MNNYELYKALTEKIGATGIVYFRDQIDTYGRMRDVYVPAHIETFNCDPISDELRMDIVLPTTTRYNVYPGELYLPSPIDSRFHGDMVPVRTYFEMREVEQSINDIHFNRSAVEMQRMFEKNAIEHLSFGFYKKDSKFDYDKIIFSGPCTIIIWKDGAKTMARVSEGDTFNPETGVAICFMKRALGQLTNTNKILRKAHEQYWDEQDKIANVIDQVKGYMKALHDWDKEKSDDQNH